MNLAKKNYGEDDENKVNAVMKENKADDHQNYCRLLWYQLIGRALLNAQLPSRQSYLNLVIHDFTQDVFQRNDWRIVYAALQAFENLLLNIKTFLSVEQQKQIMSEQGILHPDLTRGWNQTMLRMKVVQICIAVLNTATQLDSSRHLSSEVISLARQTVQDVSMCEDNSKIKAIFDQSINKINSSLQQLSPEKRADELILLMQQYGERLISSSSQSKGDSAANEIPFLKQRIKHLINSVKKFCSDHSNKLMRKQGELMRHTFKLSHILSACYVSEQKQLLLKLEKKQIQKEAEIKHVQQDVKDLGQLVLERYVELTTIVQSMQGSAQVDSAIKTEVQSELNRILQDNMARQRE